MLSFFHFRSEVNVILHSWYTIHFHVHNLIISFILRYEWWYFFFTDEDTGPGTSVTWIVRIFSVRSLGIHPESIVSKSNAMSVLSQKPSIKMALRQANYNMMGN